MAQLTSPSIDWASPSVEPQAAGVVVPAAQMVPQSVIVYTGGILAAPTYSQLIDDAAVGAPF